MRAAAVLLVLLAGVLPAQESGPDEPVVIPSLDVREMNLIDVVSYIEKVAGVNVLVSPNLRDKKITLHLPKALTWLDTLRVIADEADANLRMITEDTVRLFHFNRFDKPCHPFFITLFGLGADEFHVLRVEPPLETLFAFFPPGHFLPAFGGYHIVYTP